MRKLIAVLVAATMMVPTVVLAGDAPKPPTAQELAAQITRVTGEVADARTKLDELERSLQMLQGAYQYATMLQNARSSEASETPTNP